LGPGRYDNNYENKCIDYPLPYVRWTENRNMEAYLDLLKSKKINFETLIEKEFPLEQCKEAYAALNTQPQPLAIIFKYNQIEVIPTNDSHILTINPLQNNNINNKIHVALIGVGNFMISTHIPNLLKLKNIYEIKGVCVDNSVKANE